MGFTLSELVGARFYRWRWLNVMPTQLWPIEQCNLQAQPGPTLEGLRVDYWRCWSPRAPRVLVASCGHLSLLGTCTLSTQPTPCRHALLSWPMPGWLHLLHPHAGTGWTRMYLPRHGWLVCLPGLAQPPPPQSSMWSRGCCWCCCSWRI